MWYQHLFRRKEVLKTTWKLRLALLMLLMLLGAVTRESWIVPIAQSLVCPEEIAPSDAILVENFDPTYLVFERAAALYNAGLAARVLVLTEASGESARPSSVSQGIAEVMARVARLQAMEFIPIQEIEPISLHAAYQI